jgi:hypothetical protein
MFIFDILNEKWILPHTTLLQTYVTVLIHQLQILYVGLNN